jgi:hypothetical protein
MKRQSIAALLALLLSACTVSFDPPSQQQLPKPTAGTKAEQKEAVGAAHEFLAMIDRGDYEAIWRKAGPVLRNMSNETAFITTLKVMRKTFFVLPGRKPERLGFYTQVDPGGPIGEYVVVFFVGRSGNLTCTEKVVMQKEQGQWKLTGYFITKHRQTDAK